jgi:hypothetical protein
MRGVAVPGKRADNVRGAEAAQEKGVRCSSTPLRGNPGACLRRCLIVRFGPASQNRDQRENFKAHLLGKIGFVAQVHAAHGAKLKRLFEKIVWQ